MSPGSSKSRDIEKAREYERLGKFAEAFELYRSVNAVQDAARVLSLVGRNEDAGAFVLASLPVAVDRVGSLAGDERKLAYLAATYLEKTPRFPTAVELFTSLGERERAAITLERHGRGDAAHTLRERTRANRTELPPTRGSALHGGLMSGETAQQLEREGKPEEAIKAYVRLKRYGDAARICAKLGRLAAAARLFAEGGMPYEAAACFLKAGDTGQGLELLLRVPRTERRYRKAAIHVIRLSAELGVLNFQTEHFLSAFIASGPADISELGSFYELSRLYERHALEGNAIEVLRKLVLIDPEYKDASARLALLEREQAPSSALVKERLRREDQSFRSHPSRSTGSTRTQVPFSVVGLPPVAPMPELPPAPALPGFDAASGATIQMVSTVPPSAAAALRQSDLPAGGDPADEFVPGRVIAGRYKLIAKIGEGGMSLIFKAHDLELDDTIVLKVFLQQVRDPKLMSESVARFKQELKLSRQLVHKNIIRLYDIGMHEGHRYISMELLVGRTLEDLLVRILPFEEGLDYVIQACEGLQVAHEIGVVHRDIKPENIFVTGEGVVKLMDFGIAKNKLAKGLTMEGVTAGTPHYMAPEQISDFSNVSFPADQYALGVILYVMFIGEFPFDNEDLTSLLMMHITAPVPIPSARRADLPSELEEIILRLLAKRPEDRFGSCEELASRLRRIRARLRAAPI